MTHAPGLLREASARRSAVLQGEGFDLGPRGLRQVRALAALGRLGHPVPAARDVPQRGELLHVRGVEVEEDPAAAEPHRLRLPGEGVEVLAEDVRAGVEGRRVPLAVQVPVEVRELLRELIGLIDWWVLRQPVDQEVRLGDAGEAREQQGPRRHGAGEARARARRSRSGWRRWGHWPTFFACEAWDPSLS